MSSLVTLLKKTENHWRVIAGGRIGEVVTAQDLWNQAVAYFSWCDENPIYKAEVIRSGKRTGEVIQIPIQRPYTIGGFCLRAGITREYLYAVAKSANKDDFFFVANRIIEIIYTQKLEGAIAGLYNPIVTSKELGLGDRKEQDEQSPVIQITVVGGAPSLRTNEGQIDYPTST